MRRQQHHFTSTKRKSANYVVVSWQANLLCLILNAGLLLDVCHSQFITPTTAPSFGGGDFGQTPTVFGGDLTLQPTSGLLSTANPTIGIIQVEPTTGPIAATDSPTAGASGLTPTIAPTTSTQTNPPTKFDTLAPTIPQTQSVSTSVVSTNPPTTGTVITQPPSDIATPVPSDAITDSPTESGGIATLTPSFAPTLAPTEIAGSPTDAPFPRTRRPTRRPTAPPETSAPETSAPTMAKQDVTVEDITIIFARVGRLDQDSLNMFMSMTENWFDEAYNGPAQRRRRTLVLQSGGVDNEKFLTNEKQKRQLLRMLQQQQQNPQAVGVSSMKTRITVKSQNPNESGNTLTYDQRMQYFVAADVAGDSEPTPEEIAQMPYNNRTLNTQYSSILKNEVPGFENVATPILIPQTPSAVAPTAAPAGGDGQESKGGLSQMAIIGIAVGGGVGAILIIVLLIFLVSGGGGGKGDRDRDDEYVSGGAQPPSQFQLSQGGPEDISTIGDTLQKAPTDTGSVAEYGDQSVATVDYDYSKAYGGGGDTSVVSSAGGTMGENTRQTAGDAVATQAARAALGASFDSDTGGYREAETSNVKEEIIEIIAPAGKLGVVIDTPDDGAPVVHAVKDSSVIADQINVGDKLIAVDDEDVRSMTAIKVSKLISKKSANPSRKLTIVRTTYVDE